MPFFEFDDGRLVPAQFGHPVPDDIEPDILEAVRDQVLEVVQRPLFPVSWHGDGRRPGTYRPAGAPAPRLTSLDATGQVVTVEVVDELDSAALVAALSRSARSADLGWSQLAELYPRGAEAFRRDWTAFREMLPPKPAAGPRLVVVAGAVRDEVRPALQVLADSGVVVHEMALRQMSNGRRFLEVNELRPHQLGPSHVLSGGPRVNELTAESAASGGPAAPGTAAAPPQPELGRPAEADVAPAVPSAPDAGSDLDQQSDAAASHPRDGTVAQVSRADPAPADLASLRDIAAMLDGETPLVWSQLRRGIRHDAVLTGDGAIRLPGGDTVADPDVAARKVSGRDDVDGWRVWRFGEHGPSLADARAELVRARGRGPRHPGSRRRQGRALRH
ncbi:hypothetical protein KZX45_04175 [Georgenia sp. EYE_87]|uniref:restriction system modified-DNA reader domain-containing protein n=1 Tax=Georgenia sp. EYE_87 TaxID=2853448 RepID=UPI002002E185|nr:hypothetical protein [Georgenia sp. EYE_87]MCK6209738.1 hypothetical protein [Georgenia sp. EYE_87]